MDCKYALIDNFPSEGSWDCKYALIDNFPFEGSWEVPDTRVSSRERK